MKSPHSRHASLSFSQSGGFRVDSFASQSSGAAWFPVNEKAGLKKTSRSQSCLNGPWAIWD